MKAFVLLASLISSSAFATSLSFSVANSRAILINGNTSSCGQIIESAATGRAPSRDIAPYNFQMLSPKISFSGDAGEQLLVFSIRVEMKDPALAGGDYRCEVSGDELGALFSNGMVPWNGMLSEAVPAVAVNPLCMAIRCGGVNVSDDVAASMDATVTINAASITADGDQNPIRASMKMKIEKLR